MRKTILLLSISAVLFISLWPQNLGHAMSSKSTSSLKTDQAKAEQLVRKIKATEVLGPLAPVALSPFFGITCLSGTSILSNKGILPENNFLTGNKALNNPLVFIVFLLLSAATSVPKMTTVSKAFAEAGDRLETYAGIISYLVIFHLATIGQETTTQQVAYTAGIFTFTKETLLMVAIVVNIIVINTVKYFFELLVLISPIPALDAAFECANKAVTAILAIIYAFNPYLALLLNIIVFLICLAMFNWSRRRVKYLKAVFIDPVIAKIFGRTDFTPPAYIKSKISAVVEQADPIVRIFPAHKIHKIKKKEMCYLTAGKDGLFLVAPRLLRKPKVEKLDTTAAHIEINPGLLINTIQITSETLKRPYKLSFSKVYNKQLDSISAALKPFGTINTSSPQTASTQDAPAPEPA